MRAAWEVQVDDLDWFIPSLGVTLVSGAVAISLIPNYSGILPAVGILPMWMMAGIAMGIFYGYFFMVVEREPRPTARIGRYAREEWRRLAWLGTCLLLAGLNLTTFMWTKPLLNYLVPFWADPVLADADRMLFLGTDPWRLFTWLNTLPFAVFYHRGWFAMMILVLLLVLLAPPSRERSAVLLTYFLLWSVVGPVIHMLLPAAGPIFYEQLGYGNRFAELGHVSETKEVAGYLWRVYSGEHFAPGSGISAMPSLHIATTAWMLIAVSRFARWLLVPMSIAAAAILFLSIALGWHYAMDGVVGGGAAWIVYMACKAYYSARAGRRPALAVAG